jgi:hypothetical protein
MLRIPIGRDQRADGRFDIKLKVEDGASIALMRANADPTAHLAAPW